MDDLTRDSNQTVIERIQRDPKFAQALLQESTLNLLNRNIEIARAILRDLAKGTGSLTDLATKLGKPAEDTQALLETEGAGDIEDLNAIHDELWNRLIANDMTLSVFARNNGRRFYEKHRNDPPEGCITAMSPEIYKEIYGQKSPAKLDPSTIRLDEKIALGIYVAAVIGMGMPFVLPQALAVWLHLGYGIILGLLAMPLLFLFGIFQIFRLVYQHAPIWGWRTGITVLMLLTAPLLFVAIGQPIAEALVWGLMAGGMGN